MKHIPNLLSGVRFLLIPFFVWQMLAGNTTAGGVILIVSGATDILDGLLARRFGWVSDLGKVLDPAADKCTQLAASVVMVIVLRQYWPFFAVILLKEGAMMVAGAYLMKKGARLEGAHWFGKISTATFYGAVILIALFPTMPRWLALALLSVATLCSVAALLLYVPAFMRHKNQVKNDRDAP